MHEVGALPTRTEEEDLSQLSPMQRGLLLAWKGGFDPRDGLHRNTFHKHRKVILAATGYDIGARGPVRFERPVQQVRLVPVLPPDWYVMPDGRTWAEHAGEAEQEA